MQIFHLELFFLGLSSFLHRAVPIRTDYEDMAEMMFGQYPSFDDLMDYIQTLENEINAL